MAAFKTFRVFENFAFQMFEESEILLFLAFEVPEIIKNAFCVF